MLKQCVKHYYQWLCSTIHHKTIISQSSPDSLRIQGPSNRSGSGLLYPLCSFKECNTKGGKCKISQVLQSPVSSPQASPKVEASDRTRQAQHLPTCRKVQNGNPRVHHGISDSRRKEVVDMSDTYLHIAIHQNSRKYLRFCHNSQVFQFTSLPFGLATALQVFKIIVKEVKPMALTRGVKLHQYLDNWFIRAPSQKEAQANTQTMVDLTQSLGWKINQEKSKLKPAQVFSVMSYEHHLDSAHVKPNSRDDTN